MNEKLITKSFERILEKGKNRGFITYEELGKSLGKRGGSNENTERAFLIIADNKITLVEKKSEYQSNKKKESSSNTEEKTSEKSDIKLSTSFFLAHNYDQNAEIDSALKYYNYIIEGFP